MDGPYERLRGILERHLSPLNASTMASQLVVEAGGDAGSLQASDVAALVPRIERTAKLFLSPGARAALVADLVKMTNGHSSARPAKAATNRVLVRDERDITQARLVARRLCLNVEARPYSLQKAATIVSELARNIVSYTPGGYLELSTRCNSVARLVIVAHDSGTGIADIDVVFSGKYRSRTGLGRGLLGVKQLADQFSINSGRQGTHVEAEVVL